MPPYDQNILRSLRRITRAIDLYSRSLASTHQLTGPQLVCMHALGQSEELTIGGLSRAVSLSPATVSGILDRLERRGLAVRVRGSSDRRRVYARLTAAGRELAERAPSPLQMRFASRFGELPPEEQAEIDRVLGRVVDLMEAKGIDASPMLTPGRVTSDADAVAEFLGADEGLVAGEGGGPAGNGNGNGARSG